MALTKLAVENAAPKETAYKMVDGQGLYLMVQPSGSKLWRWNYRFNGKQQTMSYGVYPDVTLKEVRIKHANARTLLHQGKNPVGEKEKKLPPVKVVPIVMKDATGKTVRVDPKPGTFTWVERQWFDQWKAGKNDRHVEQIAQRIEADILPILGDRPIGAIRPREIAEVALAIEARGAVDLAHRSMNIMSQIFRFGIVKEYNEQNPAAGIKASDFLKGLDPRNFARIDAKELPGLMWAIEVYVGTPVTRIVLKLMVNTFLRTSELILTPWCEFTFKGHKLMDTKWTIPEERMKKPTPHIVPLSRQVVALLEELHRHTGGTDLLFPNIKDPRRPMSKNTILGALKTMGYKGQMTGHGFRGLASTILHEQGYEDAHIDLQLAHLKRNKVSAAYDWAKYVEPRTKMMQDWSDFLDEQLALAKPSNTKWISRSEG